MNSDERTVHMFNWERANHFWDFYMMLNDAGRAALAEELNKLGADSSILLNVLGTYIQRHILDEQ